MLDDRLFREFKLQTRQGWQWRKEAGSGYAVIAVTGEDK